MKKIFTGIILVMTAFQSYSQRVDDFALKDVVSGNTFSLSEHQSSAAVVLVFTTNSCPYSKLYESRIRDLANQFQSQNIHFVLVNPHADNAEGESAAEMIQKSTSSLSGLPYLSDNNQSLSQTFGISKIPEAVVITPNQAGFSVAYQGGIDNNPQLPHSATKRHLEDALQSIAEHKAPNPTSTRSVGCNLKAR